MTKHEANVTVLTIKNQHNINNHAYYTTNISFAVSER